MLERTKGRSNGRSPRMVHRANSPLLAVDARVPGSVLVDRVHVLATRDVVALPVISHAGGGAGPDLFDRVHVVEEVLPLLLDGTGGHLLPRGDGRRLRAGVHGDGAAVRDRGEGPAGPHSILTPV